MKAKPVKNVPPNGYVQCSVEEATHVSLRFPGPVGTLTLPVIQKGKREGTGCWTWNGSTESPTLRPSILTTCEAYRCHSWVTDGQAIFLSDSSHEFAGQTLDLIDHTE